MPFPRYGRRTKVKDRGERKLVLLPAELVRLLTDSPFDKLRAGSFDRCYSE